MKVYFFIKLVLCCVLLLLCDVVNAATVTSNTGGGNWSNPATWIGGNVPGANDDVVINGPVTVGWSYTCKNLIVNSSNTLTVVGSLTVLKGATNNGTITGSSRIYCQEALVNNGIWSVAETYITGFGNSQTISSGTLQNVFQTNLYVNNDLNSSSDVAVAGSIIFQNTASWNALGYNLQLSTDPSNPTSVLDWGTGSLKNVVMNGYGKVENMDLYSVTNNGSLICNGVNLYTNFVNTGVVQFTGWDVLYGNMTDTGAVSGDKLYVGGSGIQTISYVSMNIGLQFNGTYYLNGVGYWIINNPTSANFGTYTGARNIILQASSVQYVWTGAVSTDWATAGNWSTNKVPTVGNDVRIPDQVNDPAVSLTTSAYAKSVIVESPALLTVNGSLSVINSVASGFDIQVSSGAVVAIGPVGKLQTGNLGIVNNAGVSGLVIQSTSAGTGSLLHYTNGVQATVQRYVGAADSWRFLSSPMVAQSISGGWIPTGTHGDNTGYDLYVWDELSSCWVYNLNYTVAPTWTSVHPQAYFVPGRGYLYALQQSEQTNVFQGTLNNGSVSVGATTGSTGLNKGFNLIGNPYPSSIDWKIDAGYARSMLYDNSGYDIWIWSESNANYGVYNSNSTSDNGTNGVTRYIAPMQAFFVRAASAGTFVFNNSSRTNSGAGNWLKSSVLQSKTSLDISVKSVEGYGADEVRLLSDTILSANYVGSLKMFSPVSTAPNLYFDNGGQGYSILNVSPRNLNDGVALNFKSGASGKYVLSSNVEGLDSLVLIDRITGANIQLEANNGYEFEATGSDVLARFLIKVNRADNNSGLDSDISIKQNSDVLTIESESAKDYSVSIYTSNGMLLEKQNVTRGLFSYRFQIKGVYLVLVSSQGARKIQKVIF